MSDLFSAAKANLEAARQSDGEFGTGSVPGRRRMVRYMTIESRAER